MDRRRFGTWGLELSPEEFACALAALGVLQHQAELLPVRGDADGLARLLAEAARCAESPVIWRLDEEPEELDDYAEPTSARALAVAWAQFVQDRSGLLRLEVHLAAEANPFWLVQQLSRPEVKAASVYLDREDSGIGLDWNWPLRVGLWPGPALDWLRQQLQQARETGDWVGRLVRLVEAPAESRPCDLLLLPFGPRRALPAILSAPAPPRAYCALLLEGLDESPERAMPLVAALESQLQTGCLGLIPVPVQGRAGWFRELVREISHNQPLDRAVYAPGTGVRPDLLVASRQFLDRARVAVAACALGEKLARRARPDSRIEIDGHAGWCLGLAQGSHPAREVGDRLRARTEAFGWRGEGEEGTAVEQLARLSEPVLAEASLAQDRRILAQVSDLSNRDEARILERGLRKNAPHAVEVRVGAPERGWAAANELFPENKLPPNETGHRLTVVFWEPELVREPQVASIFLSRQGPSNSCRFYLHTRQETERIEARIVVLHQNRVLQTALLRAGVFAEPAEAPPDSSIELLIEADVRPGMQGLGDRQKFDAALVVNHSADGVPRAIGVVNDQAALFSLEDLKDAIRLIDDKLGGSDWASSEFQDLHASGTQDLLRYLALQGAGLYLGIVEDHLVGAPLANAKRLQRIQVIAAKPEARLPVEFIYDRTPPDDHAPVCESARQALEDGSCLDTCPYAAKQNAVVCPLGFWGLKWIIEWHRYDSKRAGELAGAEFAMQSEPAPGRNRLELLKSALLAASSRVDAVVPGGVDRLEEDLKAATGNAVKRVGTWEAWVEEIQRSSPTLLALLVHTLKDQNDQPCLEIGEGKQLASVRLGFVCPENAPSPPLVLLLGCETGAPEIAFQGFVAQFRRRRAAIVVSTTARILGRHAIPLAQEFVRILKALPATGDATFGDAMLGVRRKFLADGRPMVLCLTAYGDADWRL